jgi:hypothetical protein
MIAGNPRCGRMLAAVAVALLLLIMVSTAIIAERKRNPPVKTIPIHPSAFFFGRL